jgi:hypothetical protein
MRIVDLATFMAMPKGTIYQRFEPVAFGPIEIFGGPLSTSDFTSCDFTTGPLENGGIDDLLRRVDEMIDEGASHPVCFDDWQRDSGHDPDQMFAVWEDADLAALIAQLRGGMGKAGVGDEATPS